MSQDPIPGVAVATPLSEARIGRAGVIQKVSGALAPRDVLEPDEL